MNRIDLRPSLSGKLNRIREEGIIEVDKEFIIIKDLESLNKFYRFIFPM